MADAAATAHVRAVVEQRNVALCAAIELANLNSNREKDLHEYWPGVVDLEKRRGLPQGC